MVKWSGNETNAKKRKTFPQECWFFLRVLLVWFIGVVEFFSFLKKMDLMLIFIADKACYFCYGACFSLVIGQYVSMFYLFWIHFSQDKMKNKFLSRRIRKESGKTFDKYDTQKVKRRHNKKYWWQYNILYSLYISKWNPSNLA